MPYGKLETLQDCRDFVQGCLFMATGGGGAVAWGMSMLQEGLEEGLVLEWVDADDVPDEALTATPYGMGSIAPTAQETLDEIARVGLVDRYGYRSMEQAIRELGDYLGQPVACLVPAELGAGNTPAPLVTGARMGIPVVDGDYAGRAIPEEMQGTPFLYGKSSWPFSSVDKWGNVVIGRRTAHPHLFERIGKMLAVAAYGHTTIVSSPLSGREMKEVLVRGTLTKCLALGRTTRRAQEAGQDPIQAAVEATGGWRLFEGVVTGQDWEDRDGYMFGTTHLRGTDAYEGHRLDVWFKNENHVTWLDGEPWVCSPDLVSLVYKDGGEGTVNNRIRPGDQLVAVGMKGLEAFRTEYGLNQAAGPRYFGFDIAYVPIEVLMAGR